MVEEVKDFIQKHIQLIDDEQWLELYKKASEELSLSTIKGLTEVLWSIDCFPHKDLEVVPEAYLYDSEEKDTVVEDILVSKKKIEPYAFAEMQNIEHIVIPSGVTEIGGGGAFTECKNLRGLVIPDSVLVILPFAFAHCPSLDTVIYNGTIEQFRNMRRSITTFRGTRVTSVTCLDGKLEALKI